MGDDQRERLATSRDSKEASDVDPAADDRNDPADDTNTDEEDDKRTLTMGGSNIK